VKAFARENYEHRRLEEESLFVYSYTWRRQLAFFFSRFARRIKIASIITLTIPARVMVFTSAPSNPETKKLWIASMSLVARWM